MIKKELQRNILTHIFFITLFLVVPTLAFVRKPGEGFFAITQVVVQDTVANFVLLCFFYLNYYILVPKFFLKRLYFRYIAYVIIFLLLAFTLPFLAGKYFFPTGHGLPPAHTGSPDDVPGKPGGPPPLIIFIFDEFRRHLYLFFTAIFFSFLLRTREHLSRLKEEKLNAELLSLKSQINPHFLFNTLNTIYALSVKNDPRTPEAIINLSGLMRYVIKDANEYKIPLQEEIEYIRNYVGLQETRVGNTTAIRFECSGDPGNKEIAPLILITYIENAFKYGINPDVDDCIVDINLQVTDNGIRLDTYNKKVLVSSLENTTGIGMQNTSERLRFLYPNRYDLKVNESNETYSVTLIIQLV